MTRSEPRLFSIGEFSRLARISVRMLRHYDDRGLLAPAAVDPFTGYRWYAPDQLRTAARICALRDAGLPVAQIARLLPVHDQPEVVRQVLSEQRDRLLSDAEDVRRRIDRVDHLLATLKETAMSIDVRRTTVPAATVAALRDVIPTYADEGRLWERLMPALGASGAVPAPDGAAGATFHDEGFQEHDVDVEIWVEVAAPFAGADGVRCVDLPARDVVAATFTGPYDQVTAVTTALGDWIAEHDLELAGPMFDIYRVGPGQEPDPARWVTEVCQPVRDR
ncbi:MAG: MerR family transcriptional regulator [Micrococcales bacterium]|uniref:MerR family transcriptional regulator n=1 Tax=Cellulomonas sp. P4 TaxID=3142533 RepID=UPI0019A14F10|nr:MerR family transcriptional regulator [Micrococcales bacterium]